MLGLALSDTSTRVGPCVQAPASAARHAWMFAPELRLGHHVQRSPEPLGKLGRRHALDHQAPVDRRMAGLGAGIHDSA